MLSALAGEHSGGRGKGWTGLPLTRDSTELGLRSVLLACTALGSPHTCTPLSLRATSTFRTSLGLERIHSTLFFLQLHWEGNKQKQQSEAALRSFDLMRWAELGTLNRFVAEVKPDSVLIDGRNFSAPALWFGALPRSSAAE